LYDERAGGLGTTRIGTDREFFGDVQPFFGEIVEMRHLRVFRGRADPRLDAVPS
jgi:hypothetical protein